MQKAFIAIALALTLSCVAATYTTQNDGWVKTPVPAVQDGDINFTNTTRNMELSTFASTSDVVLLGYNTPVADKNGDSYNQTSATWGLTTKPIATKDLSSSSNTSYGFKAPMTSGFSSGYAYGWGLVNDSTTNNIPQYFIYQTKVDTNTPITRIQATSNNNKDVNPRLFGSAASGKTMMIFWQYNTTVNMTTFTIGGSSMGKEFTLANINPNSISGFKVTWGEALSSSQVYIGYREEPNYKVAVVDFSSGTQINPGQLSGYENKTMKCGPYATDKKLFGVWCTNVTNVGNAENETTTIFASSANTTLGKLFSFNSSRMSIDDPFPYSGMLGYFYTDFNDVSNKMMSKAIWDLEKNAAFLNSTKFLTYTPSTSEMQGFRVPGAGYYYLVWNGNATTNSTTVVVGQVLSGSYLTTVFGFLMTIVAGLFLF